tara:strand:+ start:4737 stop:9629 length:4893 start_codon:yes stop_codon:yes gene_type:complete
MADIRSNFIAGKMNKSVDERLVPLGEYVDALNVRLGSTESTEIGAVENSKGNTQLTFLSYESNPLNPASTSCLGVYEDGMEETIYWFVHDSANAASPTGKCDMIVSFNTNSNVVTYHVVSVWDGEPGNANTTLNFDPKFLVTGVSKIENQLFFTDDKNPPRYINVKRNYDDPAATNVPAGSDGIRKQDVNVIVKPPGFEDSTPTYTPLPVPEVTLEDFPGDENYMETRFLCFAYRYRYQDGGYSATSLFSMPAFQPGAFRFNLDTFNNAGMLNRFNGATIGFSTGSKRVVQVDLLYKESGNNVIYVIERYNKKDLGWADEIQQSLTFSNSKIFTTLGSDELLRQYDNVPRIAKAQTIQGNRLIYGNYVDGYDIVNENGQKIPINYSTEHLVEEIGGVGLDAPVASDGVDYEIGQQAVPGKPALVSVTDSQITFDLSALDLPIPAGLTLTFDLNMQSAPSPQVSGGNPQAVGPDSSPSFQQPSPFSINWTFTCPVAYASVADLVNSTEFQTPIGTTAIGNYQPLLPNDLSGQGGTVTDKFNNYVNPPPGTMEIINSSITTGCLTAAPAATAVCTQQGFNYTATATGFTLQCPAVRFYSEDAPSAGDVSEQFEFFSFIDFSSTVGYLLTADTYSLHSNRDYETGIVYMDDYGRASTVLVANDNTLYVPPINSRDKNTCRVTLSNLPPYWASKYKFVMKPSEGTYFTVFSSLYFPDCREPSVLWFKLEGDNTNIVTQGMNLVVKADTLGPVSSNVVCKVLEIRAFSGDSNDLGISACGDTNNPAGLYMCIKPGGFSTEIADDAVIDYGNKSSSSNSTSCNLSNSYELNFPSGSSNTGPYDLPAGSSIRVRIDNWRGSKGSNCTSKKYKFDGDFKASQDYPNFLLWWYGDGADFTTGSSNGVSCSQYKNSGVPFATSTGAPTVPSSHCFNTQLFVYGDPTAVTGDLKFRNRCGIPRCSSFWGDKRPGHVGTLIQVLRGGQLIIWETEPAEVDPNLFYDASRMMDIYTDPADGLRYHQSPGGPSDQDQDATNNLEVTLPFANCYTFGNGVESFRITDSPGTKSFNMGERVLAVSNQDYKEANRFAGMTYSGVYSGAANSNNLNEFNLGLVNYKDCETSFGPIQFMYSRETDILTLQEDRISYVLAKKNVISDSTGGGAIASVPQVLGTQIARIEEYGISFNPESFAAWGSDMFFTDTKRGAVINLRGTSANTDQIQVVSQYGMRSWFRDQFAEQLITQKLGGYDPYMNEYVLNTNLKTVPFPEVGTPCGTTLSQNNAVNVLSYTVNVGDAVGSINIPYNISSGSITVDATWNGVTVSSGVTATSGFITVNKTANTPNDIEMVITPVTTSGASATYDITIDCPPVTTLTIIRIVLSSPSTDGQFIHFDYNWNDGSTISPSVNDLATLGLITPTEYISQTGNRSIGVFPYIGADITMRALKQGFDDFVFDSAQDKFKYLSSSTLYANTNTDMQLLLADPDLINIVPISGAAGSEQATITTTAVNFPLSNQYLYLVWDLRETTQSTLCFSPIATGSAAEACCGCNPACGITYFGPAQSTSAFACQTNTNSAGNQQGSFNGTGSIPQIGEICFANLTCDPASVILPGFYIVDPAQPSAASPKQWIQVGANGAVISAGSC